MKSIREQREQCGWTPEEAAKACGWEITTWNVLEEPPYPSSDFVLQTIWQPIYKARMNDLYGWIEGNWPLDSVGPC